jgi:putative ABC transport system substrate-binding protein
MRRQGYVSGQNLTIDCHEFGSDVELSSKFAVDLVKANVDVIIAWGDVALRAAQQAIKTIPILAMTDDMLAEGLVNSLARPNGNTTGVTIVAAELDGKRQEILIEAVPGLRGMAVLADPSAPDAKLHALQEAAQRRNIQLSVYRIAKAGDVAAAIDTAKTSGAMALNILASPVLWSVRHLIMDRAACSAPSRHVAMARKCRGRRLRCLWTARQSARPRHPCQTAHPTLPGHQGRQAGDQPQDR